MAESFYTTPHISEVSGSLGATERHGHGPNLNPAYAGVLTLQQEHVVCAVVGSVIGMVRSLARHRYRYTGKSYSTSTGAGIPVDLDLDQARFTATRSRKGACTKEIELAYSRIGRPRHARHCRKMQFILARIAARIVQVLAAVWPPRNV